MSSFLLHELIELQREFQKKGIPLILGGGMSLFLRTQFLSAEPTRRYPLSLESRSTNDIDLFLSNEVIVSRGHFEKLKEVLSALGYKVNPDAKYFQFMKELDEQGTSPIVRLDLLAPPPADTSKVEIKKPRVRPKGVSQIHAYLTNEAAGLEIGLVPVTSAQLAGLGERFDGELYLLSCFNYLILKLHAFFDRKDRKDEKSMEGRHHALDIFTTVCRMGERDWEMAKTHKQVHAGRQYLERAKEIRRECFATPTSIGLLRIQENETFKRRRTEYLPYLQSFIDDLNDLFT